MISGAGQRANRWTTKGEKRKRLGKEGGRYVSREWETRFINWNDWMAPRFNPFAGNQRLIPSKVGARKRDTSGEY